MMARFFLTRPARGSSLPAPRTSRSRRARSRSRRRDRPTRGTARNAPRSRPFDERLDEPVRLEELAAQEVARERRVLRGQPMDLALRGDQVRDPQPVDVPRSRSRSARSRACTASLSFSNLGSHSSARSRFESGAWRSQTASRPIAASARSGFSVSPAAASAPPNSARL